MIDTIQKLRDLTGAGIMECKRALEEAGGKFEKAAEIIKEKGVMRAEKRAERTTSAGIVEAYVHNNGRIGVLVEIHAETDFVANSEPFRTLTHNLALQVSAMNPANVDELLGQPYIKNESVMIGDLVKETIAKVGENIRVYRVARFEVGRE